MTINAMADSSCMKLQFATVVCNGHSSIWPSAEWCAVYIAVYVYYLAQLSCCAYMITFRKPYIASLEIWKIGLWMDGLLDSCKLWTVGPLDSYNVKYQTTMLTTVP